MMLTDNQQTNAKLTARIKQETETLALIRTQKIFIKYILKISYRVELLFTSITDFINSALLSSHSFQL